MEGYNPRDGEIESQSYGVTEMTPLSLDGVTYLN